MRRAIAIVAIVWFLAVGAGVVEYAHNAQHACDDAQHPDQPAPLHDDLNCPIHAQLHQPLIATPAIVLLICAGLLAAFVSQLAPAPASLRIPARLDCRGPPLLV